MRRAVGLLLGLIGGMIIFALMIAETPPKQVLILAYLAAFGCFIAGIYINSFQKALEEAWETIKERDDRILKLGAQAGAHMGDAERYGRELNVMRERFMEEQNARSAAAQDGRDKATIIRRLNIILQENGIDTTAANIPPSRGSGDALASSRASRGNPVPPSPLPGFLQSHRQSMASPHPASAPVHDNSGDLLTGVALGLMLADDPAPAPARCEPHHGYSEPELARDSRSDYDSGGSSDNNSSPCD